MWLRRRHGVFCYNTVIGSEWRHRSHAANESTRIRLRSHTMAFVVLRRCWPTEAPPLPSEARPLKRRCRSAQLIKHAASYDLRSSQH